MVSVPEGELREAQRTCELSALLQGFEVSLDALVGSKVGGMVAGGGGGRKHTIAPAAPPPIFAFPALSHPRQVKCGQPSCPYLMDESSCNLTCDICLSNSRNSKIKRNEKRRAM